MLLTQGCGDAGSRDGDLLATLPSWTVQEELRIGREDDPDHALLPVAGMAVTPAGEVLVSQPQERWIRVFDREGRLVRRIGGPGDGPGEFLRLGAVGILGDTIWAVDSREVGTLKFFDLQGRWLRTTLVPSPERPYLGSARYYPLSDGGILAPSATSGDLMLDLHEQPWFRWDADGNPVGTLPGYLSPGLVLIENTITLPDGRTVESPAGPARPFARLTWMDVSPDNSFVVRAETIHSEEEVPVGVRLARYTPDGDTLAAGEIALPAQPIPRAVADSAMDQAVARLAGPLGSEERARRELNERITIPDSYPLLRAVSAGRGGRVWLAIEGVRREGEERAQDGAGTIPWIVLDPDLEPLAVVWLPATFEPMVPDGDDIWGVELGPFEIPQIVRYRVSG